MTTPYQVPENACDYRFVHASGPGGQHVNKASTAVELRVNVGLLALPPAVEQRLMSQQRNRLNKSGELVIQAEQYRSQLMNRQAALQRLRAWIDQAFIQPKKRIPTKPSRAAKQRRIDNKKKRGQMKSNRRSPRLD